MCILGVGCQKLGDDVTYFFQQNLGRGGAKSVFSLFFKTFSIEHQIRPTPIGMCILRKIVHDVAINQYSLYIKYCIVDKNTCPRLLVYLVYDV